MLELPYYGEHLVMIVVIPAKRWGLRVLEEKLNVRTIGNAIDKLRSNCLHEVALPRFLAYSQFYLRDTLQSMGMHLAFSESADLNGILPSGRLQIGNVIHKAVVAVDEEGTVAVGATAVQVVTVSPSSIQEFRADQPFFFSVIEKKTGNIVFIGRYVKPD